MTVLAFALLVVAAALVTMISLTGSGNAEKEQPRVAVGVPGGSDPVVVKTEPWTQDGEPGLPYVAHQLVVGVDIEPGTYTTQGADTSENPGITCTWARLSGLSGRSSEVIDQGVATGATSVTIQPTDKAFVTGGCREWVGPGAP